MVPQKPFWMLQFRCANVQAMLSPAEDILHELATRPFALDTSAGSPEDVVVIYTLLRAGIATATSFTSLPLSLTLPRCDYAEAAASAGVRAEPDAVARRWVYGKVEGLQEREVRLFAVWVGVDKRSAVRADVKGLVEAVVLEDVCLEVSRCVLDLARR